MGFFDYISHEPYWLAPNFTQNLDFPKTILSCKTRFKRTRRKVSLRDNFNIERKARQLQASRQSFNPIELIINQIATKQKITAQISDIQTK